MFIMNFIYCFKSIIAIGNILLLLIEDIYITLENSEFKVYLYKITIMTYDVLKYGVKFEGTQYV